MNIIHRDLKPSNIFIHNNVIKIGLYLYKFSRFWFCIKNLIKLINKNLTSRNTSIFLSLNALKPILFLLKRYLVYRCNIL